MVQIKTVCDCRPVSVSHLLVSELQSAEIADLQLYSYSFVSDDCFGYNEIKI